MNIEELVKKFAGGLLGVPHRSAENVLRAALTEADAALAMEHNLKMLQVEANHALELRAYEATVENLEAKVRELGAKLQVLRNQVGKYAEPNDYSQFPWASSDLRWEHDCRRIRRYARSFSRGIDTCPSCGMSSPFPAAPQPKKENGND